MKKVDTYINSNKEKRRATPAFLVLTFRPKSAIMYSKDWGKEIMADIESKKAAREFAERWRTF